jgi:UDP-N-acetylglucosamine 2-epimerase (non-hydrolysing)
MIAICLGTRPEIIKLASIIKELEEREHPYFVIHTQQHYDAHLSEVFFTALNLPQPQYMVKIDNTSSLSQVVSGIHEIGKILEKTKPSLLIVQGDTNATQAGALAASKLHIPIAHVESGLRSYDKRMPEEWNRIICDHLSEILFVPTEIQKQILLSEGINEENIFLVGNTITDALLSIKDEASEDILKRIGIDKKRYILATLHRQENVDNKEILRDLCMAFKKIIATTNLPIVLPLHPRTKKRISEFEISLPLGVKEIAPIGYKEFIEVQRNAALILTDSGGVQEEACILNIPCVTLRENTERPGTIGVGANILAGTDPEKIVEAAIKMYKKKSDWKHPFGDGHSGERIVDKCIKFIEGNK